jgi:hypothetical protein
MIPKKGRTYVVCSPCELAICDHWSFLFCKIDPFVSVLAGTLFGRCPEGRADPAGGAPASGCSSTDPRSRDCAVAVSHRDTSRPGSTAELAAG